MHRPRQWASFLLTFWPRFSIHHYSNSGFRIKLVYLTATVPFCFFFFVFVLSNLGSGLMLTWGSGISSATEGHLKLIPSLLYVHVHQQQNIIKDLIELIKNKILLTICPAIELTKAEVSVVSHRSSNKLGSLVFF
jgi:hypothetical protein